MVPNNSFQACPGTKKVCDRVQLFQSFNVISCLQKLPDRGVSVVSRSNSCKGCGDLSTLYTIAHYQL